MKSQVFSSYNLTLLFVTRHSDALSRHCVISWRLHVVQVVQRGKAINPSPPPNVQDGLPVYRGNPDGQAAAGTVLEICYPYRAE